MHYGHDERLDVFSLENVPVQAATSSMSMNIGMAHLLMRFQPPVGPLQPYIDVLGGLKYFMSRSAIHSDVVVFPEELRAAARTGDWVLSYGAGAGMNIRLFEQRLGVYDRPGTVSLSVGVRYLFGTEADYVTQGFFDEALGTFQFDVERSPTDMVTAQVGMRIDL